MVDISEAPVDLYLAAFATALKMRGAVPATYERYSVYLCQFRAWLGDRGPADVTAANIADDYLPSWWLDYESRYGAMPSANTVRNHHTALSSFFNYLESRDFVQTNPMRRLAAERPKGDKKKNDYLLQADDDAVRLAPTTPEERIIISLLRFTGMRAAEAYSLRWDEVDLCGDDVYPHGRLFVSKSKTAAGLRTIPLVPELRLELERWAKYQEGRCLLEGHLPVLSTKHGRPMTHDFLLRVVKRVAYRAGVRIKPCTCGSTIVHRHERSCPRTKNGHNLSAVTPHTLRRTFATALRREGTPIDVVSKILGHSSTKVTEQFYVELEDETVASAFLIGSTAAPKLTMVKAA